MRLLLLKLRKGAAPASYWALLLGLSIAIGFMLGNPLFGFLVLAVFAIAFAKWDALHRLWLRGWGLDDELAAEYQKADCDEEAEVHYKRWLARVEGLEDPVLEDGLLGLAVLYSGQGRHQEAEPHYLRLLMIDEKALGLDHWKVARDRRNLDQCRAAKSSGRARAS